MKLYIYDHCPYCLKARMIFGLKNIPVELHVLLNDDAETPTRMVGQKQVPILQKDDSRYMPESMDIVHYVDKLDGKPLLTGKRSPAIEEWLRKVNGYANKLLLPRFAKSAFDEFSTPAARKYFVDKKEASAGNFADLLAHSDGLIKNISDDLRALDKLIVKPNAVNGELSEDDIQLFPLLRNLTLVAGINWPSRVADYRDNMAKQTQIICYHQWRFNPDPPRQPVFAGCRRFQFFLLASLSLVTHAALCQDIDADFHVEDYHEQVFICRCIDRQWPARWL
ncbi:glutaredoxin 2 [Escherichia coli]|nr:glutaredoxin 2 [Escherichia coli]